MVQGTAGADPIPSGMAGRCTTALFELALEDKATDKVKADLERFDALVAESADLLRLVRSPVFTADEQTKALQHCWHRPASPGSRRISSCSWRANGASSPYARWLRPIGRWSPATRAVTAKVTVRPAALRRAPVDAEGCPEGGHPAGRSGRPHGRPRDHRRPRGQARQPHG